MGGFTAFLQAIWAGKKRFETTTYRRWIYAAYTPEKFDNGTWKIVGFPKRTLLFKRGKRACRWIMLECCLFKGHWTNVHLFIYISKHTARARERERGKKQRERAREREREKKKQLQKVKYVIDYWSLSIQVPPEKIVYPPKICPKCIPSSGSLDP